MKNEEKETEKEKGSVKEPWYVKTLTELVIYILSLVIYCYLSEHLKWDSEGIHFLF